MAKKKNTICVGQKVWLVPLGNNWDSEMKVKESVITEGDNRSFMFSVDGYSHEFDIDSMTSGQNPLINEDRCYLTEQDALDYIEGWHKVFEIREIFNREFPISLDINQLRKIIEIINGKK
jgi:hypothetical protein